MLSYAIHEIKPVNRECPEFISWGTGDFHQMVPNVMCNAKEFTVPFWGSEFFSWSHRPQAKKSPLVHGQKKVVPLKIYPPRREFWTLPNNCNSDSLSSVSYVSYTICDSSDIIMA